MQQIVSITSQGQLTIPKFIRDAFNITGTTKVIIERQGQNIIVKPRNNFWSLSGSLKSQVKLSDEKLRKARNSFSEKWGQV